MHEKYHRIHGTKYLVEQSSSARKKDNEKPPYDQGKQIEGHALFFFIHHQQHIFHIYVPLIK
jgi:hypothetical protein